MDLGRRCSVQMRCFACGRFGPGRITTRSTRYSGTGSISQRVLPRARARRACGVGEQHAIIIMLRLVTLLATVGIAAGFTALYRRRLHRSAPRKDRARQRRVTVLVRPSAARAHWKEARAAISSRLHVASAENDASSMGVLVHGCHLEADSWEDIVWGCAMPTPQRNAAPHEY